MTEQQSKRTKAEVDAENQRIKAKAAQMDEEAQQFIDGKAPLEPVLRPSNVGRKAPSHAPDQDPENPLIDKARKAEEDKS